MGFITETLGMLVPIVAIIGGIAVAIVAIWVSLKKGQLAHNLKLTALEKGGELPAEPPKPRPYPYRSGLIWVVIGVGTFVSIWVSSGSLEGAIWGIVPFLIGLALIISVKLRKEEGE